MESLLQDLRFGFRMLRKTPGFSAIAIVTLALGVGANSAIFTLLNQVFLRRLPVAQPEQLVRLQFTGSDSGRRDSYGGDAGDYFSYPMYRDLRDQNKVFAGVFATDQAQVGLQWHKQPDLANTELVSGNYFEVLGVRPALGRLFVQSDDVTQNANPVVVISFSYWQRRFGSNPAILQQTVLINGHPFGVIGVTSPHFHSVVMGKAPDVFATMTMKPEITPDSSELENRRFKWLNIFARLNPGEPASQAQAGIDLLWHALRADELQHMGHSSDTFRRNFLTNSHLNLIDGSQGFSPFRDDHRTPLLIMAGMVTLMIVMACVNIAGLLLVRAAGRVREISVRYALGAERLRILQQLLAEGLLLGLAGGSLGAMLAPSIAGILLRRVSGDPQTVAAFSSQPDPRVFAFNFALAFAASAIFSLAPIWQFWRPDLAPALKQQTVSIIGGRSGLRRVAAGAQIGLSVVLLVAAGLFLRTLYKLKTLDVGFTTDHLLTFGVDPKLAGYEAKNVPALYRQMKDRLAALPGVRSVAATNDPELAGDTEGRSITIAGHPYKEEENMNVEWSVLSDRYFSTLGRPLLVGREFSEQDSATSTKVAVVDETLARQFFGSSDRALGQLLASGRGDVKPDIQIVGVVRNARHEGVREEMRRSVFTPYLQSAEAGDLPIHYYVRTWQPPDAAENTIRRAMQQIDSRLVLDTMVTMDEQIDDNLSADRLVALLATSFGVLAALLAAIGLYGVLAYATMQRTREIGIRLALGASRGSVAGMVLAEVILLAGVSIVIALPVALLLSRLVQSQLFGISSYDPLTLIATAVVVAAVALLAAWLPTTKAAHIDPMVALRYE